MSLGVSYPTGSHLEDTQRSEILSRRFSSRIVEQVDGGDDDGDISTTLIERKFQPLVNSVESRTSHNAQARPLMVLCPSHP